MSGRHWGWGGGCLVALGLWLALNACGARTSLQGFDVGGAAGAESMGVAGRAGGTSNAGTSGGGVSNFGGSGSAGFPGAGAAAGGTSSGGVSSNGGSPTVGTAGAAGCIGLVPAGQPRIALAAASGCALDSTGHARCWGQGPSINAPLSPPSGPLSQIAAEEGEYVGIDAAARPEFWGLLLVPGPPPAGSFQQATLTGTGVACASALCTGPVQCWPPNKRGVSDPPLFDFLQIAGGGSHVCGVETGHTVQCWGDNTYGQSSPPPGGFVFVTSGLQHSCAIAFDGHVVCWGAGSAGAPLSTQNFGQGMPPAGAFKYLGAGAFHTCGIAADDSVKCWGAGTTTQNCGDPPYECGQAIAPAGAFQQVAGGITHSCGIRLDGSLVCWGSNADGRATPPPDFK